MANSAKYIVESEMDKRIARVLDKPYSRILIPQDDGRFSAEVLEFPGCFAEGVSAEDAYAHLEAAAAAWVGACLDAGTAIPAPLTNYDVTGRFALRLPKSVYLKASKAAAREGVSLNQFISMAVLERIGESETRAKLDEVLTEVRRLHAIIRLKAPEMTAINSPEERPKRIMNAVSDMDGFATNAPESQYTH